MLPVIGVTSLESLSYNEKPEKGIIVPLIDARNNQVYSGIFDNKHKRVSEYMACDIDEALDNIDKFVKENSIDMITFIGDGSIVNREKIESRFLGAIFSNNNKQNGDSLGRCSYNKFLNKEDIETADSLNPLYLRKSQAERMKNAGE